MITYIALLRGINVSGQKKILMAELREMLEKMKFSEVQTYIQSGNVVFKSNVENVEVLSEKIEKGILNTFGFDVPILVCKAATLGQIFKNNPYRDKDPKAVCFVLLNKTPKQLLIEELRKVTFPNEFFEITTNCVYLYCLEGFGKAKCGTNFFERKLQVQATTRNYNTMVKLLDMSAS
ncbi:DUF1697 domain-containing protein [Cellulophaga sp. F20128]|uniref:DUF1697 domain-containing protein n=1 Tax=Cellulophaga sp. F20128 TaxID=2926413 RepID=UPI001FF261C9|nr:DUF1697 domain-containing protein [Cellulophaga sp. F20128]MCK0158074.1 DUF1697 domain-containing protein [Cellulophaga sp. F20128]